MTLITNPRALATIPNSKRGMVEMAGGGESPPEQLAVHTIDLGIGTEPLQKLAAIAQRQRGHGFRQRLREGFANLSGFAETHVDGQRCKCRDVFDLLRSKWSDNSRQVINTRW
jgi:hypothetical protein